MPRTQTASFKESKLFVGAVSMHLNQQDLDGCVANTDQQRQRCKIIFGMGYMPFDCAMLHCLPTQS